MLNDEILKDVQCYNIAGDIQLYIHSPRVLTSSCTPNALDSLLALLLTSIAVLLTSIINQYY